MMIDVRMWGRALAQMPKLSRSEWQVLDPVAKWLIACRASVLFMTFTAAALGGLMAWRAAAFHWDLWLATVLGLVFAHATNNLLNDYTDSRRGIDKNNYYRNQYGVHVLEDGLMDQRQFWRYLGVTAAIALVLGGWLVVQRAGLTFDLMLAGAFFVLFYTWPLKYYGLGEPAVLLVWGPLMVGGTYYVLTGHWSQEVTWLSVVFALGPTTVLFGKHTDKLDDDRRKGVRTLPVLLGERRARTCVVAMVLTQYAVCIALVLSGSYAWPLLLVLPGVVLLPRFIRVFAAPKPAARPKEYPEAAWPLWFSAHAFAHTRWFTVLFLLGLLAETALH
ncbi:MAG: prenyltransferase [Gammaproteobacteria bacterium]|nr:prenyltransferase [Gammaproteobacteria bacterium]